jgi:16S rRNA (uracil1498-N3)-methyltransferase
VKDLTAWLQSLPGNEAPLPMLRCLLSLGEGTRPLAQALAELPPGTAVCFLSGPEGGLSAQEEALAREHGFQPITLGPRVLRAETAALAALTVALNF